MSTLHGAPLHLRRPHINPWLLAVSILAAALVGLTTWVVVDRTANSSAAPSTTSRTGLASPETVTMLEHRIAALNSADAQAISAFYTRDAVLEERDVTPATVTKGSERIGARIRGLTQIGMRLKSESPAIQFGSTVAEAASVPGSAEGFILVYTLKENKIAHQWVLPAG